MSHSGDSADPPWTATKPAFRADIQGLRAVAVLMVVAYHAEGLLPGGFVGVDAFFVISGFVITKMLLGELRGTGRLNFSRFYLRRMRRLLPALGLALATTLVLSILLAPVGAHQVTARTGAGAALLNANSYLALSGGDGYFGVSSAFNPLLHTWSLSVEEQFYLFFPGLVAGGWALSRRLRFREHVGVGAVLLLITAVSFPLSWLLTTERLDPAGRGAEFAFYLSPSRAWEFAVGGALALTAHRLTKIGARRAVWIAATGLATYVIACALFDDSTQFPGAAALLPVIGTLMLLAAGESSASNPVSRALGWRPFQRLGDVSYSWYLWHWPAIVFTVSLWPGRSTFALGAALLSLLPAWLSYTFVENPIRFRPNPRTGRTLALGALCIALPLGSALALESAYRRIRFHDSPLEHLAFHADHVRGCSKISSIEPPTGDPCRWPVPSASETAVLVGDSNAGQFTEAFTTAANEMGWDAVVATKDGCAFNRLRVLYQGSENASCRNFVDRIRADLLEMKPQVVVIASASDGYINADTSTFRAIDGSQSFSTIEEKATAWERGLTELISELRSAGIDVVIVHPIPKFPDWNVREMAPLRLLGPTEWANTAIPRTEALASRAAAVDAEAAAAAASGARTVDVFDALCPGSECSPFDGRTWLYHDGGHISVGASRMLTGVFSRSMAG